jgi:2-polyprenyl-3-methyl-5-hydroxy-6-metoxy-1,4-benzoquinol methylase
LEPELKFIDCSNIDVLSFENDKIYDLDKPWNSYSLNKYDLTICNQVLEHVFNPHQAFENLFDITNNNGYIWISVPIINSVHGEPFFYSSGYHPRFLERLANNYKLKIIDLNCWGSLKYKLHCVRGTWLTYNQLGYGFNSFNDFYLPNLIFQNGRINNTNHITDCWALLKK